MKKIAERFVVATLYVILCQIISVFFFFRVGIYWMVFRLRGGTVQSEVSEHVFRFWCFPFVPDEISSLILNIILSVLTVIGFMSYRAKGKVQYFVYVGLASMLLSMLANQWGGISIYVSLVSEVYLWNLFGFTIAYLLSRETIGVGIAFTIYCLFFVFLVGFNMIGDFGVDRFGMTNYYFWFICFLATLFCLVLLHQCKKHGRHPDSTTGESKWEIRGD